MDWWRKTPFRLTCLHAGTFGTSLNRPFFERIYEIFQSMTEIMSRFRPEEMAIEDLFFHKNLQSALKIGHARGAVLIAAVQNRVKIFEYSPLEIKKSVVGYGRAIKGAGEIHDSGHLENEKPAAPGCFRCSCGRDLSSELDAVPEGRTVACCASLVAFSVTSDK